MRGRNSNYKKNWGSFPIGCLIPKAPIFPMNPGLIFDELPVSISRFKLKQFNFQWLGISEFISLIK